MPHAPKKVRSSPRKNRPEPTPDEIPEVLPVQLPSEPFNVEDRLSELRQMLDPKSPHYWPEPHHVNIRAVMDLYKKGVLPKDDEVHIAGGKIVSKEQAMKFKGQIWCECAQEEYQLMGKAVYPRINKYHVLHMRVRLCLSRGGDGTEITCAVLNDSGASVQTLWFSDLARLHPDPRAFLANPRTSFANFRRDYKGWIGGGHVRLANGQTELVPLMWIECQMCGIDAQSTGWSDWWEERACMRMDMPGGVRLSGLAFRRKFYIAEGPRDTHLAVADTKGGMTSLLR